MPLINLYRIKKGGEILINCEHIIYIETESRTTTVHVTGGLLFSVEEAPEAIAAKVEELATARIANGILESGVAASPE
jgi:hypothetical protein